MKLLTPLDLAAGFMDEGPRVAVIGAGVAGASCAAGLAQAGWAVTVFDKSRGVGGRMATRRVSVVAADGTLRTGQFDHGCPSFNATRPRFQACVGHAIAKGHAARWHQHVYARFPAPKVQDVIVPTPGMPAFCRHLLDGVPQRLGHAVIGLQRRESGWWLQLAEAQDGDEGPFDQVVLAIPAAQAAPLLRDHHPGWADSLAQVAMSPCWTLMAVTDEVDWPWDAAEVEHGELSWIVRDDRKPGRASHWAGLAAWVAYATPAWSRAHLEDSPDKVAEALCAALGKLLPGGQPGRWHHAAVHRWRYAQPVQAAFGGVDCLWDARLGLAVCGDAFGEGSVEAAWTSGDELADTLAASFDAAPFEAPAAVFWRREPGSPPAGLPSAEADHAGRRGLQGQQGRVAEQAVRRLRPADELAKAVGEELE